MFDINVVIVSYNSRNQVEKCLASMFVDLKESGLNVHVTVIDNCSNDNILWLLKLGYENIKFCVNKKNAGFARAQNRGLKAVDSKYHFILNPDTVFLPQQNVIKKMYDFMEQNKQAGIVGPKILYPDGSRQNSCYRFPKFMQPLYSRTFLGRIGKGKKEAENYFMEDFEHNNTVPVDWIMGAAMFVRSQALSHVGYFDERYWMYAEDSDLCRKMWENNWMVYYLHSASIKHEHGRGSASTQGIARSLIKNRLARAHLKSWLSYMWKWKSTRHYYS
ncbi:MAG: glycosyltransferase family 2 protein [bacterium]